MDADKTLRWNQFYELYPAASAETLEWLFRHLSEIGPLDEVIDVITDGDSELIAEPILEQCIREETLTMGQMYDLIGDVSDATLSRILVQCADILPPSDMADFYGHLDQETFNPLYLRSLQSDPDAIDAETVRQACELLDRDSLDYLSSRMPLNQTQMDALVPFLDRFGILGRSTLLFRAVAGGLQMRSSVMRTLAEGLDDRILSDALRIARDSSNPDAVLSLELLLTDEAQQSDLTGEEILNLMMSSASFPDYLSYRGITDLESGGED